MKAIILFLLIIGSISANGQSMKIVGNEIVSTSAAKQKIGPEKTGYTYTDRSGKKYIVFKGARGGYFIIRTSKKTGKEYKQYLKVD